MPPEILNDIWQALQPAILVAIDGLVAIILGYIAMKLPPGLRLWFEAKHRATLQSAATNGARRALEGELDGEEAVQEVLRYMGQSAADAITYFGAPQSALRDMAIAKLQEVVIAMRGARG
jgi:hypothetical protein